MPTPIQENDFKAYIQGKFSTPKKRTARKKPCQTESVKKMRSEIATFCQRWPKVAACFTDRNPHYRTAKNYLRAEELFQIALCAYLRAYHPSINILHPKNEGKEGHVGQALKKLMGVRDGASDLLLQHLGLPDFWLELKRKPNKPTAAQLDFLQKQSEMGKHTGITYDLPDAVGQVLAWIKNSKKNIENIL